MVNKDILLQRIYALIKIRHWSLNELAVEAGLSSGMIYRWEKMKEMPSWESLDKVAEALQVPLSYLIADEPANLSEKSEQIKVLLAKAELLKPNQIEVVIQIMDSLMKDK